MAEDRDAQLADRLERRLAARGAGEVTAASEDVAIAEDVVLGELEALADAVEALVRFWESGPPVDAERIIAKVEAGLDRTAQAETNYNSFLMIWICLRAV